MTYAPNRRSVPRVRVKAPCTVKVEGGMLDALLADISPSGAKVASATRPPVGQSVKLYLRSGRGLDALVVRHTADGFALAFLDHAPTAVPAKMAYWKLDSYAFREAAPESAPANARHVPTDAMVGGCTVLAWDIDHARIDAATRLPVGTRLHLGGRVLVVRSKRGSTYDLAPAS